MKKDYGPGATQVSPALQKRWESYLRVATKEDIELWQAQNWRRNEDVFTTGPDGEDIPVVDDKDKEPLGDWGELENHERYFWQMTMLAKHFPIEICLRGLFWIDGMAVWTAAPTRLFTRKLNLDELDVQFNQQYLRAQKEHPSLRIVGRIAKVRSEHVKARIELISLESLDEEQCERIEKECAMQWENTLQPIELRIEFKTSVKETKTSKKPTLKKRTSDVLISSNVEPDTPAPRNTRTTKMLEQSAERDEEREALGNFRRELALRWRCGGDWCTNSDGLCWKDNKGQHYSMSSQQQKNWGSSIAAGKSSIEEPPSALAIHWVTSQGSIQPTARYPERAAKKQAEKAQLHDVVTTQEQLV